MPGVYSSMGPFASLHLKNNTSAYLQPETGQELFRTVPSEFPLLGFICPRSLGMVEGGNSWLAETELESRVGGVVRKDTSHSRRRKEEEDLNKTELDSAGLNVLAVNPNFFLFTQQI